MSADNGIYILELKDQYRVMELQAADNLNWTHLPEHYSSVPVPTRVVEMFGDCKFTRDRSRAFDVAYAKYRNTPICEYGIHFIPMKEKTWRRVTQEAAELAKEEIDALAAYPLDDYYKYVVKRLQMIIDTYGVKREVGVG